MKKLLTVGFLLVILTGGCDQPGDQVEVEVGKVVGDYEPKETDIVNTHGNIENLDRFQEFYKNVRDGKKEHIRVVFYTDEGDPILHDIRYDGTVFKSVMDTRRDKFGKGNIHTFTCTSIEYTHGEMADNVYRLKDCGNDNPELIILWY